MRFHARRSLAAVHYNLFLRSWCKAGCLRRCAARRERLPPGVSWSPSPATATRLTLRWGARNFDLCGHLRDEARTAETNLQKLEDQCGSSDDPVGEVGTPRTAGDRSPPVVKHEPILTSPVGRPLRIVVRASYSLDVKSLRLRYRHVTQYEDYATLEMQPAGRPDEYGDDSRRSPRADVGRDVFHRSDRWCRQRCDLAGLPTRDAVRVREIAAMTLARPRLFASSLTTFKATRYARGHMGFHTFNADSTSVSSDRRAQRDSRFG